MYIYIYIYIYVGAREWTVSRSVRWSVCRLVGWLVRLFIDWLASPLFGWKGGRAVSPLARLLVCRSFIWVRGWDYGSTGQVGRPVWLVMSLGWPLNPAGHPVHPYTRSWRPADPAILRCDLNLKPSSQHSAASTQQPALSSQHSALSSQHSTASTQQSIHSS